MNISTCRVRLVDRRFRRTMPNFCGSAATLNIEQGTARSTLAQPSSDGTILATEFLGRGGRAVECAGLENRKAERPREFESDPLRSEPDWPLRLAGRDSAGLKSRDCGI